MMVKSVVLSPLVGQHRRLRKSPICGDLKGMPIVTIDG